MPLRLCIESHTHREYQAAIAWLDTQMNNPTNDQYYMMRIAQRVQQAKSKQPNRVGIKEQIINFIMERKKPVTKEESVKRSKSFWLGFLGTKKDKQ